MPLTGLIAFALLGQTPMNVSPSITAEAISQPIGAALQVASVSQGKMGGKMKPHTSSHKKGGPTTKTVKKTSKPVKSHKTSKPGKTGGKMGKMGKMGGKMGKTHKGGK